MAATYEITGDVVCPRAHTPAELYAVRTRAAAEAKQQLDASNIVTVWRVGYEEKQGRRWVRVEKFYLVYTIAVAQADSVAKYGFCRNVTVGARSVFTHV